MEPLSQLMYLQGIAADYQGYSGETHHIANSIRQAVLTACGHDIHDPEYVVHKNYLLDGEPWQHWVKHPQVIDAWQPKLRFRVACDDYHTKLCWQLKLEDKVLQQGVVSAAEFPETGEYYIDEQRYSEHELELHAIEPGYYHLEVGVECDPLRPTVDCLVIAAPKQGHTIRETKKLWGLNLHLYTLKTKFNIGIGDLGDLHTLILKSAHVGADFIVLNPLHQLFAEQPERASPYSPCDRFLLNPIYMCIQWCEESQHNPKLDAWFNNKENQALLQQVRNAETVNYSQVFSLKFQLFDLLFEQFQRLHLAKNSERAQAFREFCDYNAHRLHTKGEAPLNKSELITLDNYLQWVVQQQLEYCQQQAQEAKMALGLILDLAVGCAADGTEVKRSPELFVTDASIGAPPDPFSEIGQNWGLPPIDPLQVKDHCYEHYIQLLRANMPCGGGLRIDHVMGLLRQWWCLLDHADERSKLTPHLGCYVYYPCDDLFAILRLESYLRQCVVIGEDLGIVPEVIKDSMATSAVYSNALFYFEQEHDGQFRSLAHFNPASLLMIANHDVPPFAGWIDASDLTLRFRLGLFPEQQQFDQAITQRKSDVLALQRWLNIERQDELDANDVATLYRRTALKLASSPVQMLSIQLEDLVGQSAPLNIPGTDLEYPNWRQRIELDIDTLFDHCDFFDELNLQRGGQHDKT